MSQPRYALYAVPQPETALARFAASWFGWDIEKGAAVEPVERVALPAELHRSVTAEPRRYGFHGTLTAPFRLADGSTEAELIAACAAFAAARTRLAPTPLRLAALGRFLALIPVTRSPALDALAARAVERLDRFRAPLSEAELERRRLASLTSAQETLLQRWGYPYVMDQFRYHMTLTGSLEPELRARIADALTPVVSLLIAEPYAIDDVALCVEPSPGAGFRVLRRLELIGV